MHRIIYTIKRVKDAIASRWRNLVCRSLGVKLEGYAWLRKIEVPRNGETISLGAGVALDQGVQLLSTADHPAPCEQGIRLRIAEGTYINRFTILDAHRDLKIGEHCIIGPFCYLTDADHSFDQSGLVKNQPMEPKFLHIEEGAWIGSHCVILPGVTIGKGAIIGAGSVVTSDIPENSIAFGSPAKVSRKR